MVIEALKRLDITCETVENGRLALDAVTNKDYDAILMDCSMPEMDGFTATRKIREMEQATNRPRHPIIALTAHVAGLPNNDWQSVGMDDYITKPFRLQELSDALSVFLSPIKEQPNSLSTGQLEARQIPQKGPGEENKPPIIDDDVMNSYGDFQEDGGAELIARLLNLFLEHAPAALSQVEEDAKGDDLKVLASAAHALKSMGRNIGAVRLSNACDKLELAAHQQTTWTATTQKSISARLRDDGDELLSGTLTNQFEIDLLDAQLFSRSLGVVSRRLPQGSHPGPCRSTEANYG